jgi:glutathione synthase/RimK-type ligase-like ATP-grasp enzyme
MSVDRRVAFATWSGEPHLSPDDELAAEICRRRGVTVDARPWDAACDWRAYAAVVLRSTWNYHLQPERFLAWVAHLDAHRVPLWNPPAVIRWNLHKRYLRAIDVGGVEVPETIVLSRGDAPSLAALLDDRGWPSAVVKPAISASAFETAMVARGDAAAYQAAFAAGLRERDLLVQQPVAGIAGGELSVIFFRGRYSHTVRKTPVPGEFRVQESLGGRVEPYEPDAAAIDRCRRVLAQVPGPTLYARIDGVPRGDTFVLLEVEVLEPSLFLGFDSGAAERFADAVLSLFSDCVDAR